MASSFDLYRQQLLNFPELGISLDFSRAPAPAGFAAKMAPALAQAFADMTALEKGAVANPDEKRMVGHYWIRTPELAPDAKIAADVKAAKAMREAGEQLEAGEFKALDTWLTNAFASNSFAFIKKTKVLESLATSLLGVSVADDFEDDPSFNSEESIDSKQVSLSLSLSLARTSALSLTINVLSRASCTQASETQRNTETQRQTDRQRERERARARRLETHGIVRVRAHFAMHAGLARTCLCPSPCACL